MKLDLKRTFAPGAKGLLLGVLGGAVGLGEFLGGEAFGADAPAGDVDDGAEEEEGGGTEFFAGFVADLWKGGAAEGEVGTGTGAGEDQLVRIDTEEVGIGAEEELDHGGVLQRIDGGGAFLFVADAVFDGDGDGAAHGEVKAVGDELGGHGGVPEASVEEDDDGAAVGVGIVILGDEEVGDEVSVGGVEVDEGVGVLEQFAVAGLSDGRGIDEFVDHNCSEKGTSRKKSVHSGRDLSIVSSS